MAGVLNGRRVLITGASSGIGAAVAHAAVTAGARVALMARRTDFLTELAGRLGGQAVQVTCDITDDNTVTPAVDHAAERLGGLDGLVNAAGLFTVGALADTEPSAWRDMFNVNVIGMLTVTRAAAVHLRGGEAPTVVNLSSMSGRRVPRGTSAVYSATKFAVHALSDGLRMQLAPEGIRVATIAPGLVKTDIAAAWPGDDYAESFRDRLRTDGLPPEAVAEAILHVLGTPPNVNVVEYALMSMTQ